MPVLKRSIVGLVPFFLLVAPRAIAAPSSICVNELPTAIASVVKHPEFERSRVGILVQTLSTGQTLYEQDARKFFVPASNTKLLTTAAALQVLGARYRIRTSVYQMPTEQGVSLRVVGRGDPSFGDAQLQDLAKQLKQRGIQKIDQLWVDESYYQGNAVNENWAVGDIQESYGVPISNLMVNANSIDLTVTPQKVGQPLQLTWKNNADVPPWQIENDTKTVDQKGGEFVELERDLLKPILRVSGQLRQGSEAFTTSVGVADPAFHFSKHFEQALTKEGIRVDRTEVLRGSFQPVDAKTEVAAVDSPVLADLVKQSNLESDNFYADAILKLMGSEPGEGKTTDRALKTLRQTLTRFKVNEAGFTIVDGSGLARQNLISPEVLVQVLRMMSQQPMGTVFRGSLPVAGMSGTLRSRFQTSPAKGIVQAKTGTLSGISALSGYISPPNYQPLVFSIIVNHTRKDTVQQRQAIDEIVGKLATLRSCL
jgi:serine-type D-Ala-D-Ala carboxypeptidase/endopeptidase (penicillin-binding protein 4)